MYEAYFGLSERPFSIAPDPQYLYMSTRHKEAMAHLSYGLSQGGCFIVLTGEVGTGKTTLCRNLLDQLPENVDVALILNANINEKELLQTICDELQIKYQQKASQKQLLDLLNQYLLASFAKNRHTVLIIDEAQLLSRDVLEQIRLLTNLETTKSKLLQIILIGQPELNDLLSRNDLRQLAQRVTARYHLGSLQQSEIEDYVNTRLAVAGCKKPLFSKQALHKMHALTDGIPRKINVLADHALLAAYSQTVPLVDSKTVKRIADEVFIHSSSQGGKLDLLLAHTMQRLRNWWIPLALLVLVNIGLWWFFGHHRVPVEISAKAPTVTQSLGVVDAQNASAAVGDSPANRLKQTDDTQQRPVVDEPVGVAEILPAEQILQNSAVQNTRSQAGSVTLADSPLELGQAADPQAAQQARQQDRVALTQNTLASTPAILSGSTEQGEVVVLSQPSSDVQQSAINLDTPFGRVLETSADATGRIAAFRNLAKLWQKNLPAQLIQPACQAVSQQGLRCLGVPDWQRLMLYNRPAILVIKHNDQLHRVIVQTVNDQSALLLVGEQVHQVDLAEVQSRWTGNGVIFWQPSDAGVELHKLDDQGAEIVALRNYLHRALNRAQMPLLQSVDSNRFDLDMSQKVFALQTRFGLTGDSRIGNETYLLMNELVAPDITLVLRQRLQ